MNGIPAFALVCVVAFCVVAPVSPSHAQSPDELAAAIDRLAVAVERLVGRLEQNAAVGSDEKETLKVQAAVAILGLRYRKIEQLESEILRISREEEEAPDYEKMMQAELDRFIAAARSESGQLDDAARAEVDAIEQRMSMDRDRIARLRERKLVLENDLTAAHRRLSHVEAVLDTWLDELE